MDGRIFGSVTQVRLGKGRYFRGLYLHLKFRCLRAGVLAQEIVKVPILSRLGHLQHGELARGVCSRLILFDFISLTCVAPPIKLPELAIRNAVPAALHF